MRNFASELFIFKIAAVLQAAFTMDTTADITSNAHGLQEGDCVQFTTATTLPAGLELLTNYYVISVTTNTFQVATNRGGSAVTSTDGGTGTHTFHLKGRKLLVADWKNLQLGFYTTGSANLTVKIQGSDQDDVDFNAAQSGTNRWDYMQIKDLEDNSSIDGDIGIVLAGTDDNRSFEININSKKYISANLTAWSAGQMNLTVTPFND